MMQLALSTRDRRTLLGGLSVIGALVVLARGVPAWRGWVRDVKAAAEEQSQAAADADALIAQARAERDTLARRNARYLALAPALVAGNTFAEASATLASFVSGAASGAGVKLGAVQLRPVADTVARRAFVRVGVHADVIGDIEGITALLATLERGPTRLRVRGITVTQADAAAPSDRVEALHADFTVEGLALAHSGRGGGKTR
jgi:Type II secretion system (T2SS), protein M subtype b